ncbi:MAG: signal peptidase I [Clostridia bacterium]|nr:signal peptidase I [Clostridia bacterium]
MKKISREIMELLDSVVIALVAVMVIFTLICRVYVVDGTSMYSTLNDADRVLVSNLFYTPEQGDIVCFVAHNYSDKVLVKRVVATEGQTIDVTSDYRLMVDGKVLEEDYLDAGIYTQPKGFAFPYTVQEGEVFCMGDNRVNSTDSRDLGPIETKYLLGRLIVRLFPNTGVVK